MSVSESELQLEVELREHFRAEVLRDLAALQRRVLALESRAGIVSEGAYGPGRMLALEREELTPEEAGIAPAAGFGTFGYGGLGAEERLRQILNEIKQPSQVVGDPEELSPAEVAGIPLARNFQ